MKNLKKKRTVPSDAVLLRKKRYIYSMGRKVEKSMTENSKVPLFLSEAFWLKGKKSRELKVIVIWWNQQQQQPADERMSYLLNI